MAGTLPFQSRFAPKFKYRANFRGLPLNFTTARRYTPMVAGFSAATAVFLLFFMEEVPPVRRDIFEHIPIIGGYWNRALPPEDNPF